MRKKDGRHSLAELRNIIGLNQTEMAALVGYSMPSIRTVELNNGAYKLSDKLASAICLQTGVSKIWLTDNNPKKKAIDEDGQPFTRQTFARHRANMNSPQGRSPMVAQLMFVRYKLEMASILASAFNRHDAFQLCCFKIKEALSALRKEFGSFTLIDTALRGEEKSPLLRAALQDSGVVENMFNGAIGKGRKK
jgi:DNA-binding XRE family transcriptional regulator